MSKEEPTAYYTSPPRLVTHATEGPYPPGVHPVSPAPYPTEVMPAAPAATEALASALNKPRRRSVWDWLAPVVTVPLVAAAGAAGMWLYLDGGAAPASCVEALEYADELNAQSEEYSQLVGQMLEAVFSFDEDAVAAAEAEGEAFAERYGETLAAYESAAAECREAGGAL